MLTESELDEKVSEIKSKISSLHIGRVPTKTLDRFKQLADDEFCSDYGMALKHLVDFFDGVVPLGTEHLEVAIEELAARIERLEAVKSEEPTRTMIDGTKRRI